MNGTLPHQPACCDRGLEAGLMSIARRLRGRVRCGWITFEACRGFADGMDEASARGLMPSVYGSGPPRF
jgi:hypothetical protein